MYEQADLFGGGGKKLSRGYVGNPGAGPDGAVLPLRRGSTEVRAVERALWRSSGLRAGPGLSACRAAP